MADYFTSAHVIKVKRKGKDAWQGVLRYQVPNPDYVEDTRKPEQRRKGFGKRPNPDYVPDNRTAKQKRAHVQKDMRKVFDPRIVRTKSQANAALTAWHAQMEEEHGAPDASLTVARYVEHFIASRERLGTITPSTSHDYRGTSRYLRYGGKHAIDGVSLRELTPRDVELWEGALLESGLAGSTALKAHRLLKQVCKYAFEIGDIPVTPVRGFKAPKNDTGRPNALDAEGRRRMMIELGSMNQDEPAVIAAQLAMYTGMRRGEMVALTWKNVDLEGVAWHGTSERGAKLRVVQAFGEGKGGMYLKEPKTASGRRTIPLVGGIVETLRQRRATMWRQWSDAMQSIGIVPTEAAFSELYVLGYLDGTPCGGDVLTRHWTEISKRLGIKGTEGRVCTLHDLRHTHATNAITRGVDVATVARNLGHHQVSTTLNMYASWDAEAQRTANEMVANELDSARRGDVLPFNRQDTGTEG